MNLKLNCKCQVIVKDKPCGSLLISETKHTLLYIAWFALSGRFFFIHLLTVLIHLPLSFTRSALNKRDKLWVTTFGCSDVTTLGRIMGLVRILFLLKVIIGSVSLYIALFLVSSVVFRGAVSHVAATVGHRPACLPLSLLLSKDNVCLSHLFWFLVS